MLVGYFNYCEIVRDPYLIKKELKYSSTPFPISPIHDGGRVICRSVVMCLKGLLSMSDFLDDEDGLVVVGVGLVDDDEEDVGVDGFDFDLVLVFGLDIFGWDFVRIWI